MKEKFGKFWWKVPVYCIIAGWLCFQLMFNVLGCFAIMPLADGTITSDNTRWMILSGLAFAAVLAIGGFIFFRSMSKKEIFYSASVMVVLNVILGLITYRINGFIFFLEISEWHSFVSQILYKLNVNDWVNAGIRCMTPYLFIPFGKGQTAKLKRGET